MTKRWNRDGDEVPDVLGEAGDPPTSYPDQGDPELSAPPDGLSDTVAADESDA